VKKRVTVVSPASSANLGAGYDVFALALRKPFDTLTLQRTGREVRLIVEGAPLDTEPRNNVVSKVVTTMMGGERIGEGVSLLLRKGVPVGVGLGSSAASSAAASLGMNTLFDLGLDKQKLIEYAGVGEKMSSGTAHYDNVAAAIVGGFVIVDGSEGFVSMETPPQLTLCLVTPEVPLPPRKTEFARSLVPKHIPLAEVVDAVTSASMMVRGFSTGNLEIIGRAMQRGFVDPRRAVMIPGFEEVRELALKAGAFGACVSGAGPTVLAATTRGKARAVLKAMLRGFREASVQSQGFVTGVGGGCRIIEQI
jgi:homoserine kinase